MKLVSRFDSKEDPALLSPWSMIHFAFGGMAWQYKKYINFTYAELLHLAYELSGGKQVFEQLGFEPKHSSSLGNNITDQAAFTLGWYFAPRWIRYDIVAPAGFFVFSVLKIGFEPTGAGKGKNRNVGDTSVLVGWDRNAVSTTAAEDRARMVAAAKQAMQDFRDGKRDTHPGYKSDFGDVD